MNTRNMKIKLAKRLIQSGNYYCPLCGCVMTFKNCNIDHIVPRCRGGGNGAGNLQLAHIECNHKKGSKLQRGYSDIQYPYIGKPVHKYPSSDYTKAIKTRMDEYYAVIDARYIHPL